MGLSENIEFGAYLHLVGTSLLSTPPTGNDKYTADSKMGLSANFEFGPNANLSDYLYCIYCMVNGGFDRSFAGLLSLFCPPHASNLAMMSPPHCTLTCALHH